MNQAFMEMIYSLIYSEVAFSECLVWGCISEEGDIGEEEKILYILSSKSFDGLDIILLFCKNFIFHGFCRVTLEDLYNGKVTKLQLQKNVICAPCEGYVNVFLGGEIKIFLKLI